MFDAPSESEQKELIAAAKKASADLDKKLHLAVWFIHKLCLEVDTLPASISSGFFTEENLKSLKKLYLSPSSQPYLDQVVLILATFMTQLTSQLADNEGLLAEFIDLEASVISILRSRFATETNNGDNPMMISQFLQTGAQLVVSLQRALTTAASTLSKSRTDPNVVLTPQVLAPGSFSYYDPACGKNDVSNWNVELTKLGKNNGIPNIGLALFGADATAPLLAMMLVNGNSISVNDGEKVKFPVSVKPLVAGDILTFSYSKSAGTVQLSINSAQLPVAIGPPAALPLIEADIKNLNLSLVTLTDGDMEYACSVRVSFPATASSTIIPTIDTTDKLNLLLVAATEIDSFLRSMESNTFFNKLVSTMLVPHCSRALRQSCPITFSGEESFERVFEAKEESASHMLLTFSDLNLKAEDALEVYGADGKLLAQITSTKREPPKAIATAQNGATVITELGARIDSSLITISVAGDAAGGGTGMEFKENLLSDGTEDWNKWLHPGYVTESWILMEFSEDTTVNLSGYKVCSANDSPNRDPVAWNLQGLISGEWTTLHSVDDDSVFDYYTRWEWKSFKLPAAFPVQAVKLEITRVRSPGDGLQLAHFHLFQEDQTAATLVRISPESLQLSVSGDVGGGGTGLEYATNLFNESTEDWDKWVVPGYVTEAWADITPANGESIMLAGYALCSANDSPHRDPVKWELRGTCTDTGEEEVLHEFDDASVFSERWQWVHFNLPTPRPVSNVRLNITGVREPGDCMQLGHFHLFELSGEIAAAPEATEEVVVEEASAASADAAAPTALPCPQFGVYEVVMDGSPNKPISNAWIQVNAVGFQATRSATESSATTISVGTKVVRNKLWAFGDEDGGSGCIGTVTGMKSWEGIANAAYGVKWDGNGFAGVYRAIDLVPFQSVQETKSSNVSAVDGCLRISGGAVKVIARFGAVAEGFERKFNCHVYPVLPRKVCLQDQRFEPFRKTLKNVFALSASKTSQLAALVKHVDKTMISNGWSSALDRRWTEFIPSAEELVRSAPLKELVEMEEIYFEGEDAATALTGFAMEGYSAPPVYSVEEQDPELAAAIRASLELQAQLEQQQSGSAQDDAGTNNAVVVPGKNIKPVEGQFMVLQQFNSMLASVLPMINLSQQQSASLAQTIGRHRNLIFHVSDLYKYCCFCSFICCYSYIICSVRRCRSLNRSSTLQIATVAHLSLSCLVRERSSTLHWVSRQIGKVHGQSLVKLSGPFILCIQRSCVVQIVCIRQSLWVNMLLMRADLIGNKLDFMPFISFYST